MSEAWQYDGNWKQQLQNYQVAGQNAIDFTLNNAGMILAFNAPATAMGLIGAAWFAAGFGALGVVTAAAIPSLAGAAATYLATDVLGLVGTAILAGTFAVLLL